MAGSGIVLLAGLGTAIALQHKGRVRTLDQQASTENNARPHELLLPFGDATRAPLVPGEINPAVTQANINETICVQGWTKTIRPSSSYTHTVKLQQIVQFHLPGSSSDYEEDHLVPLSVGGDPTSLRNLWPAPLIGPGNAHQKDQLELLIHRLVCSEQLSLEQGQQELLRNWVVSYQNRIGPLQ